MQVEEGSCRGLIMLAVARRKMDVRRINLDVLSLPPMILSVWRVVAMKHIHARVIILWKISREMGARLAVLLPRITTTEMPQQKDRFFIPGWNRYISISYMFKDMLVY